MSWFLVTRAAHVLLFATAITVNPASSSTKRLNDDPTTNNRSAFLADMDENVLRDIIKRTYASPLKIPTMIWPIKCDSSQPFVNLSHFPVLKGNAHFDCLFDTTKIPSKASMQKSEVYVYDATYKKETSALPTRITLYDVNSDSKVQLPAIKKIKAGWVRITVSATVSHGLKKGIRLRIYQQTYATFTKLPWLVVYTVSTRKTSLGELMGKGSMHDV